MRGHGLRRRRGAGVCGARAAPGRGKAGRGGVRACDDDRHDAGRGTRGGAAAAVVGGVLPRTEFRSDTILPVVRQHDGWLGVISKELPNGRIGWIAANAGLVAYRTPYS